VRIDGESKDSKAVRGMFNFDGAACVRLVAVVVVVVEPIARGHLALAANALGGKENAKLDSFSEV